MVETLTHGIDLDLTALHGGLSKYLIVQDTHWIPTQYKHKRIVSSHGSQLSLKSSSTIKVNEAIWSLVLSYFIQNLKYRWAGHNNISTFSFPTAKRNYTVSSNCIILYSCSQATHWGIFCKFCHHLQSEITHFSFKCHISLGSRSQKILRVLTHVPPNVRNVSNMLDHD